jgi:hypothetical protein
MTIPHSRTRLFAALLAFLVAGNALAGRPEVGRIRHAEAIELDAGRLPSAAALRKTGHPASAVFDAFGHRFDLWLEPNDELLRRLSPSKRKQLSRHGLYKGGLRGLDKSWLRLTRLDDGLYGAIWDGEQLYAVAPASAVKRWLDTPLQVSPGATVVYRASDVDSGLGPDFCSAVVPGRTAAASLAYETLAVELKALAASATADLELPIALLGDLPFAAKFADPEGTMLARLNTVDGIFSAQVGISVTASEVQVQTATDGGLTSLTPSVLLNQFEILRKATPALDEPGLAHLMTGRNMDGNTVGLAYVDTVCDVDYASSISEQGFDPWTGALITAHELGHNFGARHDGETNSPCASVPRTYLMAPVINGNDQFSQCSLDTMAPRVNSANCLRAVVKSDLALEIPDGEISGYTHQPITVRMDVVSVGNQSVDNARLDLLIYDGLELLSIAAQQGNCTTGSGTASCELDSLAAGERRSVDLEVRGSSVRAYEILANLSAPADEDSGNDDGSIRITLDAAANGAVSMSPQAFVAAEGQVQHATAILQTTGPYPLEQTVLALEVPAGVELLAATGDLGSCIVSAQGTTCDLGHVPADTSLAIKFDFVGHRPLSSAVIHARIQSANDDLPNDDEAFAQVTITPAARLELQVLPGADSTLLGDVVTRSFVLSAAGLQSTRDVVLQLSADSALQIETASADDALCEPENELNVACVFSQAIDPGESRQVQVRLKGSSVGQGRLSLTAFGLGYADRQVDVSESVNIQVTQSADVRITGSSTTLLGVDHVPLPLRVSVESVGLTASENVGFRLPLPQEVHAISVASSQGECSFSPNIVTCSLGTISPGQVVPVDVQVIADAPVESVLTPSVTADGDADTSNDAGAIELSIRPNIDLAILPLPFVAPLRVGAEFEYVIAVGSATQPVPEAGLAVTWMDGEFEALQGAASQGECAVLDNRVECSFGLIPAATEVTVTLQMRASAAGAIGLNVSTRAPVDVRPENDRRATTFDVLARGDVRVQFDSDAASGQAGASLALPGVFVEAPADSQNVSVTLSLPASFVVESARTDLGNPCDVEATTIRCVLGDIGAGAGHRIGIDIRPTAAGTFTIPVKVTADDDENPDDNEASLSVTISPRPGPAPTPAPTPGGGGGGKTDPALILTLLTMMAGLRRRRQRRSR